MRDFCCLVELMVIFETKFLTINKKCPRTEIQADKATEEVGLLL